MITKDLATIDIEDLKGLVADQLREGKTLDYKRELPGSRDKDKKEFLADASSFANTSGGDLLFGVVDKGGAPDELVGIPAEGEDREKQRLENLLRTGLEPRLPRYEFRAVPIDPTRIVLILRVWRSWNAPHRVTLGDHSKFYGRNSAGKYALDVEELRSAFTLLHGIERRIHEFHTERLLAIEAGDTPAVLIPGGRLILHLLPVSSFTRPFAQGTARFIENPQALPDPMNRRQVMQSDYRPMLEGAAKCTGALDRAASYVLLFRTGAVESVCALHSRDDLGRTILAAEWFEGQVLDVLPSHIQLLRDCGAQPPVIILLSVAGVGGIRLQFGGMRELVREERPAYPKDILRAPEVVVNDLAAGPAALMKPVFDAVWNAFGFPRSESYDASGAWIGRQQV